MRIPFVTVVGLSLLFAAAAPAQRGKYSSPAATVKQTIGGAEFKVDYYAPSMHGRKVMGGLVPYGEVWCTGANIATGFTVGADIRVGSLKLPKGEYSIWTLPREKEWTLIVNKETGQFHLNYDAGRDLGRTKMNLKTLTEPVETFRVELRDDGANKGTLALLWEQTEASISFTVLK
ncbi:MAG: hypothetical protein JWN34_6267 [Bryobacterales bacterium]|jgi:hypothetical protein|nr:hypothetical protein [Bryobacterales bacterium]